MKKAVLLLLILMVMMPTQVLAKTMTATEIEKLYFENYKGKLKEVQVAQRKLSITSCLDVKKWTDQSKKSVAAYNKMLKEKAEKTVLSGAKELVDRDKKALSTAKKECSNIIKEIRQQSNVVLKEVQASKAALMKEIKAHNEGKDGLNEEQFKSTVNNKLTNMYAKLDETLAMINKRKSEL